MRRWGSRSGLQAVGGRGPPLDTLASGLRIRRFRVEAGVLILILPRSPICDSGDFSKGEMSSSEVAKKCIKISTKVFCLFLLLPLSFTGIMFVDVLEFVFLERGRAWLNITTTTTVMLPSFSYRVYIHGRGKGGRFAAPKGLCIVKCKPSLCAKQVSHKRFKAKDFIMFKYWLFL